MWVKICANTNVDDALLAAELGADAVGFVFAPSKRQVTSAQVAKITSHLPENLERVGVFPNWSADAIAAAVREAGLTTVQLHGGLDLNLVHALRESFEGRLRIIQTVHWIVNADESSQTAVAEQLRLIAEDGVVDRVLVDSKIGAAVGGTGIAFDWTAAQEIFSTEHHGLELILAGGLRPDNAAEAIELLEPYGVDVASGVEVYPGRKDAEKLARFLREVKSLRTQPAL